MKKTVFILILLLAAVSAFALNAKVLDVVGKVEIQLADGNWEAIAPGTVLGPGTVLSTGFKSEAVISIDETTINVKALTRLTIEKLYEQEGNKASSFYLDAGALSADVKSAEDKKVSFKVKTPAVTASVRGTAGDLTVNSLVGTSGTWLLTPPEPKTISYNRGDAAPSAATEEVSSAPAPEAAAPAAPTEAAGEEAAGAESGDDFDWSIDNGEVTVQPGQSATFAVGQDVVTPMETAAAAATSTGGAQTLSAQEAVASSAAPAAPSGASAVLAEVNSALSSDLAVGASTPAATPATHAPKTGTVTVTLTWPSFN